MTRRILLIAAFSMLGAVQVAEAANDTISTAWPALLGEKRLESLASSGVGYFRYVLTGGRSYAAFCWPPFIETIGSCTVEIRDFSDTSVGTSLGISAEPFPASGSIAVFTPANTVTSTVFFVRVTNNSAATNYINVILIETTLAAPWYFTAPSAGYEAYVEIRNNTARTVNVTVRAYANTGGTTPTNSTTVTVPANGNTAVRVNGDLGITGSGSVTLTYDAMPGGVVANVTTLSATTGLSFDAPATPRMVWSINGYGQ